MAKAAKLEAPALHIDPFQYAVLVGDIHVPFQDDAAVNCAKQLIGEIKPSLLVDMGDGLDCYSISSFDKSPWRKESLQDEIDQYGQLIEELSDLTPGARRVMLDSNHLNRLTKTIYSAKGGMRDIVRLDRFQQNMTWPKLLDLEVRGWEWVPEPQQPRANILPFMVLKHGTIVRKGSAMSARGEYERLRRSGASGHTHRLGTHYHNALDGGHVWLETGCLCDKTPEYIRDGHPDWNQGLTLIMYRKGSNRFQTEQVYIEDGKAIWRGRDWDGAA